MILAVSPRPAAVRDVEEAVDYYLSEAGQRIADRFVDALEAAYDRLSRAPGVGSPLLGAALGFPNLRTWPVPGFPYLICYEAGDHDVDVWRVLQAQRDLGAALSSDTH